MRDHMTATAEEFMNLYPAGWITQLESVCGLLSDQTDFVVWAVMTENILEAGKNYTVEVKLKYDPAYIEAVPVMAGSDISLLWFMVLFNNKVDADGYCQWLNNAIRNLEMSGI